MYVRSLGPDGVQRPVSLDGGMFPEWRRDGKELFFVSHETQCNRSPWQNACVERFIGSVRRKCLDHVVVLSTAGLRRVLKGYVEYSMASRTHLALEKDTPVPRPVAPRAAGRVVAIPQVGGLHQRYERRAA